MGQLLVRDVEDDLVRILKRRAVGHGRSAEAEHKAILEEALRPQTRSLAETLERLRDETRGLGGPTGAEIIRDLRDGTLQFEE